MNYYRLFFVFGIFLFNDITFGQTEVFIGNPTGFSSNTVPIHSDDRYSYAQLIYTSTEIGMSGSIRSIEFDYRNTTNNDNWEDWVIYMKHVSKSNFSSGTDWEIADLTQVFDGKVIIDCNCSKKVKIDLDIPFQYDDTYNLLIAIQENTEGSGSNGDPNFRRYTDAPRNSLSRASNNIINVAAPGLGNMHTHVPNISIFFADPYYWVNGSGNWSDAAGHWATSSGGSDMHTTPPTEDDDVFFDALSGLSGATVTVDGVSYCKDLSWTATEGEMRVENSLNVHGNLLLTSGMTIPSFTGVNVMSFRSTESGNTIETNGVSIGCNLNFDGVGGEWSLLDPLNFSRFFIRFYEGVFNTNDESLNITGSGSLQVLGGEVNFGSSTVNFSSIFADEILVESGELNFQSSTIINNGSGSGLLVKGGIVNLNSSDLTTRCIRVNNGTVNFFTSTINLTGATNIFSNENVELYDLYFSSTSTIDEGSASITFTGINNVASTNDILLHTNGKYSNNIIFDVTPGIGISLASDLNISGDVTFNSGSLELSGGNLILSSTSSLIGETNANRIFGTSGLVTTTRDIGSAWSNETFGNMGLSVTTAIDPGIATISRGHTRQTGLEGNESIERYFIIEPTVNTGLDATLQFSYFDAEVPGGYDEDEFVLYRSTDAGSTWEGRADASIANPGSNYVELAGIDAFSHWTVSDHAVAPLPIQLTHFSATPYEEHVLVSWTTESELNNHYFELERAGEDAQFEIIHSELGAGNSSTTIDYYFRDDEPLKGLSYYLLRQVDFDGQFETFGPISVYRDVDELVLLVYPNPGDGNVMIQFVSPHKTSGMLKVLSTDGKVVVAEELNLSEGTNSFPIQLNNYPKGTYFFVFESEKTEEPIHLKYVKM